MHSLNHETYARIVADERVRSAERAVRQPRDHPPPGLPVRARVAYAAGRLARRLDREMARRAVA